jgi:putative FmdB family regulatory protein
VPIYEYQCTYCMLKFERLMKVNSDKPRCPLCNCSFVDKLVSKGSFVLKGSGWYKDGYGLKKGSSDD